MPLILLAIPSLFLGIILTWRGPPLGPLFGLPVQPGLLDDLARAGLRGLEPVPRRDHRDVPDRRHRRRPDPDQRRGGRDRPRARHLAVRGLPQRRSPARWSSGSRPPTAGRRFLYRASLNKWWFDDLNHLLFIVLGGRVAAGLWWFDRVVIDGTVNGIGGATRGVGGGLRRIQTGRVQNYALGIAIGLLVMAGSFLVIVWQPR